MKTLFLNSFLMLFALNQSYAATQQAIELTPAERIKLESLGFECSKPGEECPKVELESEDIELVLKGEDYRLSDSAGSEVFTAETAGLLVPHLTEKSMVEYRDTSLDYVRSDDEESEAIFSFRFVPISKVDLSPDENYYMCDEGKESKLVLDSKLKNTGVFEKFSSQDLLENFAPTAFVCKCFWAPQSLFDELDLDKLSKDQGGPGPSPLPPGGGPIGGGNDRVFPRPAPGSGGFQLPTGPHGGDSAGGFDPEDPFDSFFDFDGKDPVYPDYEPDQMMPSPVGSPCGMLQFGCMLEYFQKD